MVWICILQVQDANKRAEEALAQARAAANDKAETEKRAIEIEKRAAAAIKEADARLKDAEVRPCNPMMPPTDTTGSSKSL